MNLLRHLKRLSSAACLVALVIAVFSQLGVLHWTLDVLSNFALPIGIGLVVLVIWMAVLRLWRWVLALLIAAVVVLGRIVPYYLPPANFGTVPAGAVAVRVFLSNVLTSNTQYPALLAAIDESSPDVVMLNEVDDAWLNAVRPRFAGWPCAIEAPQSNNFGIALYAKFPCDARDARIEDFSGVGLPSVVATLRVDSKMMEVVGTHPLPPGSSRNTELRNLQLKRIADYARGRSNLIVIGDLNVTPWSPTFVEMLGTGQLRDSTRGFGVQASWSHDELLIAIPIDHILLGRSVDVIERRVLRDIGSDHRPVFAKLVLR